jgi:hypothetical protein
MQELRKKAITGLIWLQIITAAMLFAPPGLSISGRRGLFGFSSRVLSTVITFYFLKHNPGLVESRLKAGPTAEHEKSQKIIQTLTAILWCALNPVLATAMAQLAQIEPHPRAAVGLSALFKALSNQDSQLGVLFPTLTILLAPMRGKAAFAHLEGLTQSFRAILMLELFHHREPCGGISADKMPKAFLKCHAVGSHTPVRWITGGVFRTWSRRLGRRLRASGFRAGLFGRGLSLFEFKADLAALEFEEG